MFIDNSSSKNYDYSTLNLSTLIEKAKAGDDNATLQLINKYKNLILKYSSTYHLKNYEKDDLIQLGSMSVIKAIKKYDISKGATYLDSYIINSIKNSYKQLARSNIKYGSESSLNIIVTGDGDAYTDIQSLLCDDFDLENHILNNMQIEKLNSIISTLSSEERDLIKASYFSEGITLHSYCQMHNLNYTNKRRQLLKLLASIKQQLTK